MDRRVIISDIDGTLLRTTVGLTQAVKDASKAYMDRGHLLGLCTGRSLQAAAPVARDLQVNLPCIVFGGALIYDFQQEKVLFERTMDSSISEVIANLLAFDEHLSITVSTREETWTIRSNETLATKGIEFDRKAPIKRDLPKDSVLKVLLTCANREVLFAVREIIPKDLFFGTFASEHFFEIVSSTVDKGASVCTLRKLMNFEEQDIWVAGDALSDLQMKAYAQWFLVPEDALPEVVKHADELIPSVKVDGMKRVFDAW